MAQLDLKVVTEVKGADKLRGLAGDVAKVAAGATAALAGVGIFTAGFASDMNESLAKVGVVFGENAKDIEKWSKDSAKSLGISQQAALESVGTFGNLFDAMGVGEKPTADMSKGLVELASDLASFNNIDPAEALEKLRAGIVGEAEPLRTLGVNISAAATEQKALELGLIKSGEALTAADKATANYALIMEQTTNAQGDFARTSDGMANQQRTLAAVFQDTMATVGQAFVPIIEAILPQLTAGLQAFGDWVSGNGPAIGDVLTGIGTAIGNAFTFFVDNILPAVIAAVTGIVGFITENMPTIQAVVGTVFTTISGIVDVFVKQVLPGLLKIFGQVVGWIKANLPTISAVVGQIFGAVANVIKTVAPIILSVAEVLFPAVGAAASVLFSVLDVVFKGIGGAFEVLGNVFSTVSDAIGKVLGGVVGAFKGVYNAFARFWNSIQLDFPSLDIPFFGKIGGFSLGLPDIPMLASGGIVSSPTLAMIGEKGPEAVVPLDKGGVGTTIIEVTVLGDLKAEDEKSLADAIGRVWWANGFSDSVVSGG